MRSYIQIDSISIDLANSIDKSTDAGKCEQFSMRGYVSEIRKKDWKLCWPFPLQDNHSESEEQSPSFPPLDVPKIRKCRREFTSEGSQKDERTDLITECRSISKCSNAALRSDTQQVPKPVTFEGREIDLNNSTNLSSGNDHAAANNDKEKNAEVAHSRLDHEIGVEDLNHQITSLSPEIYRGMRQEGHTNNRDGEGKEVFDVELATNNLNSMAKSSAEICNEGTTIAADDQCQKIEKASTVLGEGTIFTEAENKTEHTTGLPPLESVACHHTKPGSTDNLVKNEFQDHHQGKSTGLPRKRPRKVRLLTDLLSGKGETKTEPITKQGSPSDGTSKASAASGRLSIPQGKEDVRGDLTKTGQSRKRKFILDKERSPAEMCSWMAETELPNSKEDTETTDTILNTGSKDVFAGIGFPGAVKSYWCKPEIEGSHTMGKKKNKKIQVVDNHLLSQPHKGRKKQNQINRYNEAYPSKTTSRLAPAFTEEGMNNFSLHSLRTENEAKFSKGKGKMLPVEEELVSLSSRKNGMLLEDSFAHTRAKIMPNMILTNPIPSEEGALNERDLKEGLHLSLNSYLAAQVCNKKRVHQIENQLPFSLPFQEGTSKAYQFIGKDRESYVVGEPIVPFKCVKDDISREGVRCEDIAGARNAEKTAEALEQAGILKKYGDQTADKVSEQGTEDDVPMEIVELMAKNQYERGLPDAENGSRLEKSTIRRKAQMTVGNAVNGNGKWRLLQEGQKEKLEGRHEKNGMFMRGENARPHKRNSVHCFSPDYQLNVNSLCQTQFPVGIEVTQPLMKPSSRFHFSPLCSSQLGSGRNCRLNGSTAERGSSDATLQVQGGCSFHETILRQDDKASRIGASLSTPNRVSQAYDILRNIVGSLSISTKDKQKQNMKTDTDLNYKNLNSSDLENLNRKRASGSFSSMNAEYPFPCKHNETELHQNLRGSQYLYSNETIPAMHLLNLMDAGTPFNASVNSQMPKRPSYPGDCNAKLEIGTSKALGSLKRPASDYYSRSYLSDKSHGCFLGYPTFGASPSVLHDEKFVRDTDFGDLIFSKSEQKDKMKSSNSTMHNKGTNQFIRPCLEKETSLQRKLEVHNTCGTLVRAAKTSSGSNTCNINRNPADFTILETGNVYMIKGEDLKFETASSSRNRPDLLALHKCRHQKNLKPSKLKEHARH